MPRYSRYPRRYRRYGAYNLAKRRARFGARYAGRLNRKFVLGRLGARLGSGAGRVGAGLLAIDAMRAARGAYRRYQRRSGPGSKRASQVSGEWQPGTTVTPDTLPWHTLETIPLVDIERGTGIRQRLSGRVFIKGFKICCRFRSELTFPVEVHWAIFQEKVKGSTALTSEFFRDTSFATQRTRDFVNRTGSGDVYDIRQLCNPINSERFNVITHRKFRLRNKPTTTTESQGMGWYHSVDTYIPIKRRVSYESVNSDFNEKPWYIAFWWLPIEEFRFSDSLVNLQYFLRKDVYYSDGRM